MHMNSLNYFSEVRVNSPIFGRDLLAYAHELSGERGEYVNCRVVLDDDHSAMQDAIADGHDPDQAEFFDFIAVEDITTLEGDPFSSTQAYRAAVAKLEAEAEARRMAAATERLRKRGARFTELGPLKIR
jgi:hypothetical protein